MTTRAIPRVLAQRSWWVLTAWLAIISTVHALIWAGHGWVWFPEGSRLLFSSSWSHLYAQHADLQIGPLTFVLVAPVVFALPARAGEVTAVVLMAMTGLVVLGQLRALLPAPTRSSTRSFLIAGLCLLTLWAELAVTFAHADDVLAILFTVLALRALRLEHAYLAACLLALAADCKPWAVIFVPLLLLIPHRDRLRAGAVWASVIAAAWLPFYLADRHSLAVATFGITNDAASSLRVLGVNTATTPSWDRAAQLVLALTLGIVAIRRGRWSAVLLVTVAARLLLDPGIKSYYDAALLTGTVLSDLLLFAGPVPLLSISAVIVFYLPMFWLHAQHHTYGVVRTAYLATVILAVLLLPDREEKSGSLPQPDRELTPGR